VGQTPATKLASAARRAAAKRSAFLLSTFPLLTTGKLIAVPPLIVRITILKVPFRNKARACLSERKSGDPANAFSAPVIKTTGVVIFSFSSKVHVSTMLSEVKQFRVQALACLQGISSNLKVEL
jgi:hypothetical protein